MRYDGVVLAGGEARRLGGVTKPAICVGGRSLLDIAVDALSDTRTTIVVGAELPTRRAVFWTREQPPGGGPVAGLAAALELVTSRRVVVLAADLPFVSNDAVSKLVRRSQGAAAAIAVDDLGRDQPLLASYDVPRLRAAMPASPSGASMRSVIRELEWLGPIRRVRLTASPPATLDCDTDADLERARLLA